MGKYLFGKIDENICLYKGYVISNSVMNDQLLKEMNLKETCETEPENNTTTIACYNVLRFTDIENPEKLYVPDTIGIDNQVTCKLHVCI